jgi:hypothetical protein
MADRVQTTYSDMLEMEPDSSEEDAESNNEAL